MVSAAAAAADSGCEYQIVFRLPDPRLLRLVSRSILITAAVISFPWIRAALLAELPPKTEVARSGWFAVPYTLPALLNDLQKQGFLRDGDRSIFLGDHADDLTLLRQYQVDPVPKHRQWSVSDHSVDFLLAPEGLNDEESYDFVERVLLVGGLAAVRLGCINFFVPSNFRVAYIRKFGSTFVVMKKMSHSPTDNEIASPMRHHFIQRRQLLAVSAGRRAALEGLEDALFEPPSEAAPAVPVRYLPELLVGESLDSYPRRVFVDVVPKGNAGTAEWFDDQYPTGGREFETVRVDAEAAGSAAKWLWNNVREEDFVVMKAEAEVMAEVIADGVVGLVDELFLECKNEWYNGSGSKRAYWECLALFGRLRREGVAVHQWWD